MADWHITGDTRLDGSGFNKGLSAMTVAAGQMIGNFVSSAAGKLAQVGQSALGIGMSFDASMSQVAATMGTTREAIGDLADAAMQAGATSQFTATQAAQALNYLALAGYDAATAADVLPSVLHLAAAGGMDLAYASDLATDSMAALGLEANKETLDAFGNRLAKAASSANATVAQLGEAVLTIGGTAQAIRGAEYMLADGTTAATSSTAELTAALGLLANVGIKGAEGGTHLRNIVLSLQSPIKQSAEMMEALGLEVYDATGSMRPLNEILMDLDSTLAGLSEADRAEALNAIFNRTDMAAVNALLAVSGEEWANLALSIDDSAAAMDNMADTQLDNLQGAMTKLSSAAEGMALGLYKQVEPALTSVAVWGAETLGTLATTLQTEGPAAMLEAAGDIISGLIDGMRERLPGMVDTAAQLISQFAQYIGDNLPGLMTAAAQIIAELIGYIGDHADDLLESAITILSAIAQGITDSLPIIWTAIGKLIIQIGVAILDHADDLLEFGGKILSMLAEGLVQAVGALIGAAATVIARFLHVFDDSDTDWKQIGTQIIGGVVQGIKNGLSDITAAAKSIGSSALNGIKNFLGIHSPSRRARDEVGVQFVLGIIEGFRSTQQELTRAAVETVDAATDAAAAAAADGAVRVSDSFKDNLVDGIVDSLPSLFSDLTKGDWGGLAKQAGGLLWAAIPTATKEGAVSGALSSAEGMLSGAVTWITGTAIPAVTGLISGVVGWIADVAIPAIIEFLSGPGGWALLIIAALGAVVAAISGAKNRKDAAAAVEGAADDPLLSSDRVQQARAIAAAESSAVGQTALETRGAAAQAYNASWQGTSTTVIEIDGREVARSTADYMDEELGFRK